MCLIQTFYTFQSVKFNEILWHSLEKVLLRTQHQKPLTCNHFGSNMGT